MRRGHTLGVEKRIRRAVEMRRDGLSLADIGQEFGVSRQRAAQYLGYANVAGGFARSEKFRVCSRARDDRLRKMVAAGATRADMAVCLGLSPESVASRLKKLGLQDEVRPSRVGKPVNQELRAKVLGLHERGVCPKDIAQEIGVGKARVYQLLHEVNVRLYSPERSWRELANASKARAMFDGGASVADVAVALNRGKTSVHRYLRLVPAPCPGDRP